MRWTSPTATQKVCEGQETPFTSVSCGRSRDVLDDPGADIGTTLHTSPSQASASGATPPPSDCWPTAMQNCWTQETLSNELDVGLGSRVGVIPHGLVEAVPASARRIGSAMAGELIEKATTPATAQATVTQTLRDLLPWPLSA